MAEERIVLGSGLLYVMEYTGSIPSNDDIEVDDNIIGYIQGGATVSYTPAFYEAKDDLGYVSKIMITDEEVILSSGIMTWNGATLKKLCLTARVTESDGKRVVKIGGMKNFSQTKYIIHFVHEDDVDGDVRITIVGNNQNGFEIAFQKDKETVVNAEFKALPQDDEGTLILYEEEI